MKSNTYNQEEDNIMAAKIALYQQHKKDTFSHHDQWLANQDLSILHWMLWETKTWMYTHLNKETRQTYERKLNQRAESQLPERTSHKIIGTKCLLKRILQYNTRLRIHHLGQSTTDQLCKLKLFGEWCYSNLIKIVTNNLLKLSVLRSCRPSTAGKDDDAKQI